MNTRERQVAEILKSNVGGTTYYEVAHHLATRENEMRPEADRKTGAEVEAEGEANAKAAKKVLDKMKKEGLVRVSKTTRQTVVDGRMSGRAFNGYSLTKEGHGAVNIAREIDAEARAARGQAPVTDDDLKNVRFVDRKGTPWGEKFSVVETVGTLADNVLGTVESNANREKAKKWAFKEAGPSATYGHAATKNEAARRLLEIDRGLYEGVKTFVVYRDFKWEGKNRVEVFRVFEDIGEDGGPLLAEFTFESHANDFVTKVLEGRVATK